MKKGFTLVELSVVVVILTVISVLVVPKVKTVINNNKEKVYNASIKSIKSAAEDYVYNNTNSVNLEITSDGYSDITIEELMEAGFLSNDLKNPYDDDGFSTSCYVRITKSGNIYSYQYVGSGC